MNKKILSFCNRNRKSALVFGFVSILLLFTFCLFLVSSSPIEVNAASLNSGWSSNLSVEKYVYTDNTDYKSIASGVTMSSSFYNFTAKIQSSYNGDKSTYNGADAYSGTTKLRIYNDALDGDFIIDGRYISSDSAKKVLLPDGVGTSTTGAVRDLGVAIGKGVLVVTRDNVYLQSVSNIYGTVVSDNWLELPEFSTAGFYQCNFYFESCEQVEGDCGCFMWGAFGHGNHGTKNVNFFNHRITYSFYVLPRYDNYGSLNTVALKNATNADITSFSGNIPKGGIAQYGLEFDTNSLSHLIISIKRTSSNGVVFETSCNLDGTRLQFGEQNAKYEITVNRGPFFIERFTVYVCYDAYANTKPLLNGAFTNTKGYNNGVTYVGTNTVFSWDANSSKPPRYVEVKKEGALFGNYTASSIPLNIPGSYSLTIKYNFASNISNYGFSSNINANTQVATSASYSVNVAENDAPSINKGLILGKRFNNTKTRWYDVQKSDGTIMSFYTRDKAVQYAYAVEDIRVNNKNLFISYYLSKFVDIRTIVASHDAAYPSFSSTATDLYGINHSHLINYMRSNSSYNAVLTAVMDTYAQANVKLTYFKLNDSTQREFDADTMFDGVSYLDDDFQFINGANYDSKTVEYKLSGSISWVSIPYYTAIKNINSLSSYSGVVEIKETGYLGHTTSYSVVRDKTAPTVRINNNGILTTAIDGRNYVCDYFSFVNIFDEFDEGVVLKVGNEYYVQSEINTATQFKAGVYSVTCYDRNYNSVSFSIIVNARTIVAKIKTDNETKTQAVTNNGSFAANNFTFELNNTNIDLFFDIFINGVKKSYSEAMMRVVSFGAYTYSIVDKFDENNRLSFSVVIAERTLAPSLIFDDDKISTVVSGGSYNVHRFKLKILESVDLTCTNAGSYIGEYVTKVGSYKFTAIDKYNGHTMSFTVSIEEKSKSVLATKENGNSFDLSEFDGKTIEVKKFHLAAPTIEQIEYLNIYVNSALVTDYSHNYFEFGYYTILIINKYDQEQYSVTLHIESRELSIEMLIDNSIVYSYSVDRLQVNNFIIGSIPDHINVFVNYSDAQSNSKFVAAGKYDVVITDIYNLNSKTYRFTIVSRILNATVAFDLDRQIEARSVSSDIYVRRFKLSNVPSFVRLTINNTEIYGETDYFIAEGKYIIRLQDIFSEEIYIFNVYVENEKAAATLILDDGLQQIAEKGGFYTVYRFKFAPLNELSKAYITIKVNGKQFVESNYIEANSYFVEVLDSFNPDNNFSFVVVISERAFASAIYLNDQNAPMAIETSNSCNAYSVNIKNSDEFAIIYVDNFGIKYGEEVEITSFGTHIIRIIDIFNNSEKIVTITISHRVVSPKIMFDDDDELIVHNGGVYNVYRFKVFSSTYLSISINGEPLHENYVFTSGDYLIASRDVFTGVSCNFTISINATNNALAVRKDSNVTLQVENFEVYNVMRFRISFVNSVQSEYLQININGENYLPNNIYFTGVGEYRIIVTNKYSGYYYDFAMVIYERSLALPVVYNNGVIATVDNTISAYRFKMGDISSLQEYANVLPISDCDYSSYLTKIGEYSFTITDIYTGESKIITVFVDAVEYSLDGASNISISLDDVMLHADFANINLTLRIDGRDSIPIIENGKILLNAKAEETHYYLKLVNIYNPADYQEIYLIVRGG